MVKLKNPHDRLKTAVVVFGLLPMIGLLFLRIMQLITSNVLRPLQVVGFVCLMYVVPLLTVFVAFHFIDSHRSQSWLEKLESVGTFIFSEVHESGTEDYEVAKNEKV